MDVDELKELILGSNKIFLSRGNYKGPVKLERDTIKFAFASIVSTKFIKKGGEINKKKYFSTQTRNW